MDSHQFERLQAILDRFEVSIAEAHELAILLDYDIVIICDDSGSMRFSSLPDGHEGGKNEKVPPSRWDELQSSVRFIVELGSCFNSNGVDVFFLHGWPKVM